MKIDPKTSRLLSDIASTAKTGNVPSMPIALPTQPSVNTAVSRSIWMSSSGPGDFNAAKVERVRSSIEAGTYKVDPGALADNLLANAHAFLFRGVF